MVVLAVPVGFGAVRENLSVDSGADRCSLAFVALSKTACGGGEGMRNRGESSRMLMYRFKGD